MAREFNQREEKPPVNMNISTKVCTSGQQMRYLKCQKMRYCRQHQKINYCRQLVYMIVYNEQIVTDAQEITVKCLFPF